MDLGPDLVEWASGSLGEGVGGVAVGTPEVAPGQSDEDAGESGKGAFPLQAQIDLVDDQASTHGRGLSGRGGRERS